MHKNRAGRLTDDNINTSYKKQPVTLSVIFTNSLSKSEEKKFEGPDLQVLRFDVNWEFLVNDLCMEDPASLYDLKMFVAWCKRRNKAFSRRLTAATLLVETSQFSKSGLQKGMKMKETAVLTIFVPTVDKKYLAWQTPRQCHTRAASAHGARQNREACFLLTTQETKRRVYQQTLRIGPHVIVKPYRQWVLEINVLKMEGNDKKYRSRGGWWLHSTALIVVWPKTPEMVR